MHRFFKGPSYEFHAKGSVMTKEGDANNQKAYVLITGKAAIVKKIR